METQMIVSVTERLKTELIETERLFTALDSDSKLNDRDHYTQVVESLESLVIATLAATSSAPLTAMSTAPGARFDMGAGTPLAHHVTATVAYLRDTATELLARGGFGPYADGNVRVALDTLKRLNGLLLEGIVRQAESDLGAVKARGVLSLVSAADRLARVARDRLGHLHAPDAPELG